MRADAKFFSFKYWLRGSVFDMPESIVVFKEYNFFKSTQIIVVGKKKKPWNYVLN